MGSAEYPGVNPLMTSGPGGVPVPLPLRGDVLYAAETVRGEPFMVRVLDDRIWVSQVGVGEQGPSYPWAVATENGAVPSSAVVGVPCLYWSDAVDGQSLLEYPWEPLPADDAAAGTELTRRAERMSHGSDTWLHLRPVPRERIVCRWEEYDQLLERRRHAGQDARQEQERAQRQQRLQTTDATLHDSPPPPGDRADLPHPGVDARIRLRRRQLGMTREQLARQAGMSLTYSHRLQGLGADFDPSALMRIAAVLEMPYEELLHGRPDATPGQQLVGMPVLARMTEKECWEHLGTHGLGRLGHHGDGEPSPVPVGYLVDGRTVICRTPQEHAAGPGGEAVFEAGHLEDDLSLGWSVTLTGTTAPVTDPETITSLTRHLDPQPRTPKPSEAWVRITPTEVTGHTIHTRHATDQADGTD